VPDLKVILFNVEHGLCAFVKSPTGRTLLIDCGKATKFSPIKYIVNNELSDCADEGKFAFTQFIISHPHGDHLEDIERLKLYAPRILYRQRGYDWEEVKEVNSESGAELVESYKKWQETYDSPAPEVDWGFDLSLRDALTPEEAKEVNESKMVNNSSVPVIITYNGSEYQEKFFFSGDLEEDGWKKLLKRESFKRAIKETDFFITSHHGHSSGYCKEIYEAMGKPIVNIVSARSGDESVEPSYSSPDNAIGKEIGGTKRYMLSTRSDGSICISVNSKGKYSLWFEDFEDNIQ
jgi:beta-lactamase superfamily II metal-dependent hydrolase